MTIIFGVYIFEENRCQWTEAIAKLDRHIQNLTTITHATSQLKILLYMYKQNAFNKSNTHYLDGRAPLAVSPIVEVDVPEAPLTSFGARMMLYSRSSSALGSPFDG